MDTTTRSAAVGPSWFAVAVRALAMLADSACVCPSAAIAGEVRTHAVFLRRILAQLARAGIVEAREGRDGGYQLCRPAESITLADVYQALNAASPIAVSRAPFDTTCPGDSPLGLALGEVQLEIERGVIEALRGHTVASVMAGAARLRAQTSTAAE
jgi:Rrf2 family transcriptional regulator, repressor of oqxAB